MNEKFEMTGTSSNVFHYALTLVYDLLSNPVNICLLFAFLYLLYKVFKLNSHKSEIVPDFKKKKIVRRNLTLQQLREFDGVKNEIILIGLNGKLYDVTSGSSYYGPDGPYGCLAGRDATRALATFSLDSSCLKDDYDDISDLSPSEMDQVKEWEIQLENKYHVVGKLLRPGEVCEIIDSEEEEISANATPLAESKFKND